MFRPLWYVDCFLIQNALHIDHLYSPKDEALQGYFATAQKLGATGSKICTEFPCNNGLSSVKFAKIYFFE
jgi:hypothetical protein